MFRTSTKVPSSEAVTKTAIQVILVLTLFLILTILLIIKTGGKGITRHTSNSRELTGHPVRI